MSRILLHFEGGHVLSMYDCFEKSSMAAARSSNASYFESLEEYIEKYSGFSDLDLENFRYIFLYYFLFNLLVFAVFLVPFLVKLSKKLSISITLQIPRGWMPRLAF